MGAPMGRAPTMRAPPGRPPQGAPKGAPPVGKTPAPVALAKAVSKVETNVPKAPPINWFFSWIKKEPFGDNVPLV